MYSQNEPVQKIAQCSMMAALGVVMMIVGSIADLGMYAAPMFTGLCLLSIGQDFGRKYHLMFWLVISILSFIMVPNIEQNLMFFVLFGFYPIIRPSFEKLGKIPRIIAKILFFNVVTVALEAMIMMIMVPGSLGTALTVVLLVLGNFTFKCAGSIIQSRAGPGSIRVLRRAAQRPVRRAHPPYYRR